MLAFVGRGIAGGLRAALLIFSGSASASFTAPVQLNPSTQPGVFPVVGVDGEGDSLVAWWVEGVGQVRARSISATGVLGAQRVLANTNSGFVHRWAPRWDSLTRLSPPPSLPTW